MSARRGTSRGRASGFTLTELAVVVAILALILGGVVVTMSAMTNAREVEQTQQQLNQAREALAGFFLRNGRFPCPAAAAATGVESPAGGGVCTNPYNGFLPAATLGIGPTDPQGYLQDAWGNRIRYAVSQHVRDPPYVDAATCAADAKKCYMFTTTNALAQVGIPSYTLPGVPLSELRVCDVANCAGALDFRAPAVVYSGGKNGAVPAVGTDEQENTDGDSIFVSRTPTPFEPTPTAGFDDLVIWLSPNILFNRLIAAGAI